MTGVRDYSTGELKHNVVAWAKAAKALNLPACRSDLLELMEALPGVFQVGHFYDRGLYEGFMTGSTGGFP
jgi:hypothetical protein